MNCLLASFFKFVVQHLKFCFSMRLYRLLLLFCFVFCLQVATAQLNTANLLSKGRNAIYFDDYTEAITKFNEIIRVKPYLPEPYLFRALAKYYLEDFEGAEADYTKAISINPNYTLAYLYRGVANNHLKKYRQALKDFNMAEELSPSNADIFANRGITLAALKQFDAAEINYTRAIKLKKDMIGAYLNRAVVREQMEDIEGAIADCNKAVQLNNFSADAFGHRAYLKYKNKQYKESVEDYERALKLNPDDPRLFMGRGISNYAEKNLRGALADYDKVVQLDPNNAHGYYNRALLKSEVGDLNSAIDDFNMVLDMNPDNMLIYFNRGLVKADIGDNLGAIEDYTTAIKIYPDFAKAYLARSSAKRDLNDMDGSIQDRNQGLIIIDKYKRMKNEGAMAAFVDTTENFQRLIDLNSREKIVEEIIKGRVQDKFIAIKLEADFHISHLSIDSLRAGRMQYYDQDLMNYNQKLNYSPAFTYSNKHILLPQALMHQKINNAVSQVNAGKNEAYFYKGTYELNQKKFNSAIASFNACIEKNKDFAYAYFNRANAIVDMTDYIQSIGVNENANLSLSDDKKGKKSEIIVDYSSAIEDYTKAIKLDPNLIFAYYNRANIYAKSKQFDKAIADYGKAIKLDSRLKEAYYNRGLVYLYNNDKTSAYGDLSKAGELGLLNAYNVIKRYCNKER